MKRGGLIEHATHRPIKEGLRRWGMWKVDKIEPFMKLNLEKGSRGETVLYETNIRRKLNYERIIK
jgi:hypothetical protein